MSHVYLKSTPKRTQPTLAAMLSKATGQPLPKAKHTKDLDFNRPLVELLKQHSAAALAPQTQRGGFLPFALQNAQLAAHHNKDANLRLTPQLRFLKGTLNKNLFSGNGDNQ